MENHITLQQLISRVDAICVKRQWQKDWLGGGCYLHLEVSEFIESLRGKGDSNPVSEAGDVLFVLLAMLAHHQINVDDVLDELKYTLEKLEK